MYDYKDVVYEYFWSDISISGNSLHLEKETIKMKKTLAIFCCAAIAVSCMLLAGCGGSSADLSDSEYVGTWVALTIDAFGQEETTEDVSEALDTTMTMTLNEDGTLVADFGGTSLSPAPGRRPVTDSRPRATTSS